MTKREEPEQHCARCGATFKAPVGGYCTDGCLRATLTADLAAIWDRMPEDARARVHHCFGSGVMTCGHAIATWESAERNQRSPAVRADDEAKAAKEDELDEALLDNATKGVYGPAARDAVLECSRQMGPRVTRRAFLRAVRKAVQATRDGSDWKPSKPKSTGRQTPDQAPLPLGGKAGGR